MFVSLRQTPLNQITKAIVNSEKLEWNGSLRGEIIVR